MKLKCNPMRYGCCWGKLVKQLTKAGQYILGTIKSHDH